ncbi:prevent-host-death family protein [Spinactinospora alkalitolerans]|uniref:Antitoxin n=1 Tax=Spinactinospora alkalitolerans TaxID=687207 RepID=A0A852TN96_9ACTN|nr:type II toxin-antitoxin system prevent-host-death family antitoxin [Spinactinospora alkalitolerans]NYE45806.1 prevent-host-death family protein [Spinactinospora alkalitolerans]
MATMPLSEARNRLAELIDHARRTHERVATTRRADLTP